MACCCWWCCVAFVACCWRDEFICTACLMVTAVCTIRFTMCELIFLRWSQLCRCWSLCSSCGWQICWLVQIHLALMWSCLTWGIVGTIIGCMVLNWSMSGPQWACDPSPQRHAGLAHWLGVVGWCTDFLQVSQSLGRQCIVWRGSVVVPADCMTQRMWCCSGAWHQELAYHMSLLNSLTGNLETDIEQQPEQ